MSWLSNVSDLIASAQDDDHYNWTVLGNLWI